MKRAKKGTKAKVKVKAKSKRASRAASPRKPAAKAKKTVKVRPRAKAPSVTSRPSNEPGDWRAKTLERMRALIMEADPSMVEERKWRKPSNAMAGVPVWSHDGIVCTGETYKSAVKLTFAQGASVPDPSGLFNASLEGGTRRAIDIHEGEEVDAEAFKALILAAVARNAA